MNLQLLDGHEHIEDVKMLFAEHLEALGLDVTKQDLEEEFANLDKKYARHDERLYIAYIDNLPAGCIVLRHVDSERAEMKRIYVRPNYRRMGLGQTLAKQVIEDARDLGYHELILDTLPPTESAKDFYMFMGFKNNDNGPKSTTEGALFLHLPLR